MTEQEKCDIVILTLKNLHKGDPISDTDLILSIKQLTNIVYFTNLLGREFLFFQISLRNDLYTLESFLESRKANLHNNGA